MLIGRGGDGFRTRRRLCFCWNEGREMGVRVDDACWISRVFFVIVGWKGLIDLAEFNL